MQSNKVSKKTNKNADGTLAEAPEKRTSADAIAKPRSSRSSKTKKTEATETGSLKHHRPEGPVPGVEFPSDATPLRSAAAVASAVPANTETVATASTPAAEPVNVTAAVQPAVTNPEVTNEQIARLAYIFWIERGYADGGSESDWLRAERELKAKR